MTNDRPRSALAAWVVVAALLPVLYVLSNGPAFWLFDHKYLSHEAYSFWYWPLGWLAGVCPPFSIFLMWYISLW